MAEENVNQGRRKFLTTLVGVLGGVGALFAAIPFLSSWFPSARAKAAGAPVKVDITNLKPGGKLTVQWRGKPVWIIRRDQDSVSRLSKITNLRDPESKVHQQPDYAANEYRSINPEYLVLVGVCTHLGCSPTYVPEIGKIEPHWPGGFYCPCHGSKFDLAGRVFTGVPAPINLEVPPYHFDGKESIVVGEDAGIV